MVLMDSKDHVSMYDKRLDGLSVGRRLSSSLGLEPRAIEFCVYQPGAGFTAKRPSLPFQFEVSPWNSDDDAHGSPATILRASAMVSNHLNPLLPMPTASFAFALALPPSNAEDIYYADPVADAQQAAADAPPAWLVFNPNVPHAAVRDEISRIFMLPGTTIEEGREGVSYTGRVIGHRLSRRDDRYAEPGSGPWTLLRIVGPGAGWVALNLWGGWGEVFSAGRDENTTVFGQHLARAIA